MPKKNLELEKMRKYLQNFLEERDWQQFNTPKNVTMALAVEAAELLEIFQWLTEKESFQVTEDPTKMQEIQEEVADIFSYLLRLTNLLDIDLNHAFWEKVKKNEKKYPAALVKGKATKYNK